MNQYKLRERLYHLWRSSEEITNTLYVMMMELDPPLDGLYPQTVEEVYQWDYLRRILRKKDLERSYSLLGCNLWTNTEEDIQSELKNTYGYLIPEEDRIDTLRFYLQQGNLLGTRKIQEILMTPRSTAYELLRKMMELPNIEKTQNKHGAYILQWRKEND